MMKYILHVYMYFREKKKEKLNGLLQKAESLEKHNENLRQECYRLEAEKRYLVKMLMDKPTTSFSISSSDDRRRTDMIGENDVASDTLDHYNSL